MILPSLVLLLMLQAVLSTTTTVTTTHSTCYTAATPTPSSSTCNVFGRTAYPYIEEVGTTLTTADCAQQCRYTRSCKSFIIFPQAIGGICTLYNTTIAGQGSAFTPTPTDDSFIAYDQRCFVNAYCPPLVLPPASTPCGAKETQAVLDKGFETPLNRPGSPWIAKGVARIFRNASIAHSGSRYGNMTVKGNGVSSFSQQLSDLDPFTHYIAQGYVGIAHDDTEQNCFLATYIDGLYHFTLGLDRGYHVNAFSGWNYFIIDFTPPRADPVLSIVLTCHNVRSHSKVSTYVVDDLSITFPNRTCPFALQLSSTTNATLDGKYLGFIHGTYDPSLSATPHMAQAVKLNVAPGEGGGALTAAGLNVIASAAFSQPDVNSTEPIAFVAPDVSPGREQLVTCNVGLGVKAAFACAAYQNTSYPISQFQYCRKRLRDSLTVDGLAIVQPGFPENYKHNGCYNVNVTAVRF